MTDHLQEIIIGLIVAAALVSVVRRLMPGWSRKRQQQLAQWLDRPDRNAVMRSVGRFLTPDDTSGGGCGSGCNTCSSCDSPAQDKGANSLAPDTTVKPVDFHRHT